MVPKGGGRAFGNFPAKSAGKGNFQSNYQGKGKGNYQNFQSQSQSFPYKGKSGGKGNFPNGTMPWSPDDFRGGYQ
eukprot:4609069-Karenia_brevis.AAC.1